MRYADKLNDARWLERRCEIINRDNGACLRCRCDIELQVHHIRYLNGREPWEYPNRYLVTLCEVCHKLWHSRGGEWRAQTEFFRGVESSHCIFDLLPKPAPSRGIVSIGDMIAEMRNE